MKFKKQNTDQLVKYYIEKKMKIFKEKLKKLRENKCEIEKDLGIMYEAQRLLQNDIKCLMDKLNQLNKAHQEKVEKQKELSSKIDDIKLWIKESAKEEKMFEKTFQNKFENTKC